jgi:CxxC-x17-CxxC domain-containing protein
VPYNDIELVCANCGNSFTFTAGEQEFYASRGLTNQPRRCPACRQSRQGGGGGGGGGGGSYEREMFSATCANCGREARVPFQPRGDRPVYCSDCFRSGSGGGGGGGGRSQGGGRSGGGGQGGYRRY